MRPSVRGWALWVLLLPGLAWAEVPGGSDAERLFEEGRALMLDQRFEEACPKIAESQRIEPRVGTLLNLAVCHEQTGKVATAWVQYQQVLTSARAEGQTERERLATERIAAIEGRVPWLTLGVSTGEEPVHGLSVRLDGAPLEPMAWNREMPVDPGEHRVVATAPERKTWELQFTLREGQRKTIHVPSLSLVVEAKERVSDPPVVAEEPVGEQREEEPESSPWVFEIGLLAGFLGASGGRPKPEVEPRSIAIYDSQGTYSDCSRTGCSYTMDNNTGALVAVHGSVSHALSDSMRGGVRMLFGPRLGKGGGSVFAAGPSLTAQVTEAVWVGGDRRRSWGSRASGRFVCSGRALPDGFVDGGAGVGGALGGWGHGGAFAPGVRGDRRDADVLAGGWDAVVCSGGRVLSVLMGARSFTSAKSCTTSRVPEPSNRHSRFVTNTTQHGPDHLRARKDVLGRVADGPGHRRDAPVPGSAPLTTLPAPLLDRANQHGDCRGHWLVLHRGTQDFA